MPFEIKAAVRSGIRPLIGLSGVSGGGKSRTALLLARGLAGPKGRITLIDSESGRGSIFADKIPGGYNVIDLDEPFTSERYLEAFEAAEANSDVIVQDSISHEWLGVLEAHEAEMERMAGNDWKKREQVKMTAWIKPKMGHKAFLTRILRAKVPVIVCFRAEIKTKVGKKDGKTTVTQTELPEPIFDPRFFFEMLICADVYSVNGRGGFLNILKITHEDLYDCLPAENHQLGIEHGEAIARWCNPSNATPKASAPTTQPTQPSELQALKRELWSLTAAVHQCKPGDAKEMLAKGKEWLSQHLLDEGYLSDTESLDELPEARLREVIEQYKARQQQKAA